MILRYIIFFFYLLLLANGLFGQTILKGIVTRQNSGKKPLENVQVTATLANPTRTISDGTFTLGFSALKPGDHVFMEFEYPDFEVVNKHSQQLNLGNQNEHVSIYMCPKGEINKQIAAFYKVNEEALTAQFEKLKEENKNNIQKIAQLGKEYEIMRRKIVEYSEKLAIVNTDEVSERFKKAYDAMKKGEFDEVIRILDEAAIDESVQKNKKEIKRADELEKVAIEKKIAAENGLKQNIEEYLLKANAYEISLRLDSAERLYAKAFETDTTMQSTFFEYARFLVQNDYSIKAAYLLPKCDTSSFTDEEKCKYFLLAFSFNAVRSPETALAFFFAAFDYIQFLDQILEKQREYYQYTLIEGLLSLDNFNNLEELLNFMPDSLLGYSRDELRDSLKIFKNQVEDSVNTYTIDTTIYSKDTAATMVNLVNNLWIAGINKSRGQYKLAANAYESVLYMAFSDTSDWSDKDSKIISLIYLKLADTYWNLGDFQRSIYNIQKSNEFLYPLFSKNKYAYGGLMAMICEEASDIYFSISDHSKYLSFIDSAILIYEEIFPLNEFFYSFKIANLNYSKGLEYSRKQSHDTSYYFFLKGMEYAKKRYRIWEKTKFGQNSN